MKILHWLLQSLHSLPATRFTSKPRRRRAPLGTPVALESLEIRSMLAVVLPSLPTGSQYQLAFLTANSRTADSDNIATYNSYVAEQAALNPDLPAATWNAIVSTKTVNARDNAIAYSSIPIYNTSGQLVASGSGAWWYPQHAATLGYDQFGLAFTPVHVWTGTNPDGSRANALAANSSLSSTGTSYATNGAWVNNGDTRPSYFAFPFYALSSILTAGGSSSAPSSPTALVAAADNGQVSLSWTAPTSSGGTAITDYEIQYSSNNGSTWTPFSDGISASVKATVTGLTNYTGYVFRVRAVNAAGVGSFSETSTSVEPASSAGDFITAAADGGLAVTAYTGADADVVIPRSINGSPITMLSDSLKFSAAVASVTIPSSVNRIDLGLLGGMFSSCDRIRVADGNSTFTSVDGLLYDKAVTTLLTCPGGKTGPVLVPSGVTTLGLSCFSGCRNLSSVSLPSGLTRINLWAFSNCTGLAQLTLPESVTLISPWAFSGCTSLTTIVIPSGVKSISQGAFSGCNSLTSVTIPNSVTSIGNQAFSGCSGLVGITLPNSITSIASLAFSGCRSLSSIDIPAGVTSIVAPIFQNCSSLASISVDSGNATFASKDGALYDKTISRLIQWPEGKAGPAIVPRTVTSLGDYAFYLCRSLTAITFEGDAPALGSNSFDGVSAATVFYYAGRANWGTTYGGLPTREITDSPQMRTYAFTDEAVIKSDWLLQGNWRVEGNGVRLLDFQASLTSKKTYDSSTQKVVFAYDITPNTQMWLTIWGETLAFEVPSSKVGSVVATVQRQGDTITFDSGNGSSTVVKIKQANLATATPLVLKMDQRNLYRPTMELLLKSAQITTNAFLPTYKPTDLQLSSLEVGEGQAVGATVGALSTTDAISSDYTYSLVAGTGAQDNGSFTIVGNQLRTNAVFSLSTKSSYAIRVRTTDKNQQWYEESFTITVLGVGIAQTQSYSLSDEAAIKSDWLLQGNWRIEGNGMRLLDFQASLTSKKTYDSSTQKVVFAYDITPNTQMWLTIWGETLAFEVPSSKVGSVVATVQRQGDTITFDSGNGSSTVVKIKQANLATATPLVLKMDQRNLYRPTMELLLKSAQITTSAMLTEAPDFPYIPNDTGITITAYTGVAEVVVVPTSIDGSPVTQIGIGAFRGKESITRITLPDGLTRIGDDAFSGCGRLTNINIPNGVTDIGANAFIWCGSLVHLRIPASVTSIGIYWAFWGCNSLASFDVDTGNTVYASKDGLLYNKEMTWLWCCPGGKTGDVILASTTTTISYYSLVGCTRLTNIEIPANVTLIEGGAFSGCTALRTLRFLGNAPAVWQGWCDPEVGSIVFYVRETQGWDATLGGVPTATTPSIPPNLIRTAGNGQASLTWSAPASNGGSAVTDYLVEYSSNGGTNWTTFPDGISTAASATVTGLTNGTSYVFRVAAVNNVGTGTYSATSAAVTPVTTPSAPTVPAGIAGNGQASLTWTAPTSNGGSAITDYQIQFSSNSGTTWITFSDGTSTATSATVTGLTNGTSYVFRVAAINGAGTGAYSSNSSAMVPATTPISPTGVAGTPGNAEVSLSWIAPASNGGAAVTDYVIQYRSNSSLTWTTFNDGISTATLATVTGLANGTSYVFRVAAVNSAGTGAYSANFAPVAPRTISSAPNGVTASAGSQYASLSWTAPTSNGGSAITDYQIQFSSNSGTTWTTFSDGTSTATSATVTGLTNGTSYVFRVAAINGAGTGSYSAATTAVTPATVPLAPTGVTGTRGNAQASLVWTAPTSNGGAAITDYLIEYSSNSGTSWTTFNDGVSTATSATVTGLINGTSYVFRIAARNRIGGTYSATSAAVTPATTPSAPTVLTGTAGNGQASLTWSAPASNGGSAVTDYVIQYTSNSGSTWTTFNDGTSTATSATVTGLTNGTSYVFRVAAVNSAGSGPYSANSAAVVPINQVVLSVTAGQFIVDAGSHNGTARILKQGAGTLILDKANTHTGGTIVEAGEIVVRNTAALGEGVLFVAADAKLTLDVYGATVSINDLSLVDGGLIDVGYGRLTVPTGHYSLPTIRGLLQAGYATNWNNASGFTSWAVGSIAGGELGYLVNVDDSITFGFAAVGDANLDGRVDILDAASMVASTRFNSSTAATWAEGDFNYDGVVDVLDVSRFLGASHFNAGTYIPAQSSQAPLPSGELTAPEAAFVAIAMDAADFPFTPVKKPRITFR